MVGDLGRDRGRLRSVAGSPLVHHYAIWDDDDDSWFTDGPVVLDFGSGRFELAAFKLHVCVSWDSIDLDDAIEWIPGSTFRLSWRRDPFGALLEGAISSVVGVEYRGDLNGFGFGSADAYFEFFNALDELGLRRAPDDDPEIRHVAL